MLKKIVKFGNSNALVLDKAILELLNMGEGSVVKLKTDGKSLIITPQHEEPASEKPSQSFEEFIYTEYASKFSPDAPASTTDPKAIHEQMGALRDRQKRLNPHIS